MTQKSRLTGDGEAPKRIPAGVPRRGSTQVAKAYVEGLERDRERLRELEQSYDKLVWETIQISAYAKALYTALYTATQYIEGAIVDITIWDKISDLLEADRRAYNEVWSCECGHHRWDHDEDGHCEYLTCRRICG